jgi:hypothetical protein
VKVKVFGPTGGTHDKDANSPPANTLTSLGNGMYLMALWGSGNSANSHDSDLALEGTYGVKVYPTAAEFATQIFTYDVRADFDVKAAFTYSVGTAGQDQISGCLSITRWNPQVTFFAPLTATNRPAAGGTQCLYNLSVVITDKDSGSNILSVSSNTVGDFTENTFDGNVYFTKAISGITGARVLTARVKFAYVTGLPTSTWAFDFPLPARFAA